MRFSFITDLNRIYEESGEVQQKFFELRRRLLLGFTGTVVVVAILLMIFMWTQENMRSLILSAMQLFVSGACFFLAWNKKVKLASYIFLILTEVAFIGAVLAYFGQEAFPLLLLVVVGFFITTHISVAMLLGGVQALIFSTIAIAFSIFAVLSNPGHEYLFERLPGIIAIQAMSTGFIVYSSYMQGWLYRQVVSRNKKIEEQNKRLERLLMDLEEQKKKAERATKYKSEFLAKMSHELRTPLHSVIGITDLLRFGCFETTEEVLAELEKEKGDDLKEPFTITQEDFFKSLDEDGNCKRALMEKFIEYYQSGYDGDDKEDKTARRRRMLDFINQEERETFKAYKNIKDSGDYLLSLINGILNVSKVESGRIEIQKSMVDIKDFSESVMVNITDYASSKGKKGLIDIELALSPTLKHKYFFDKLKVRQVLLNLLSNAVKFTDKGKVTLRVQEDGGGGLYFEVEDSGHGISEDEKTRVFMEFERMKNSVGIEGTGLGLALSKMIVEKHDGSIGFFSEYGSGSTFYFSIPSEAVESV